MAMGRHEEGPHAVQQGVLTEFRRGDPLSPGGRLKGVLREREGVLEPSGVSSQVVIIGHGSGSKGAQGGDERHGDD